MKKRRRISLLLSFMLIMSSLLGPLIVLAEESVTPTNRVSGIDRVETAIAISQKYWPQGAQTVIVTFTGIINNEDKYFSDALSSVPLGSMKDAPILFMDNDGLRNDVKNELIRLQPSVIYIIGGTGVISSETADKIKNITNVTPIRIGGLDRYETAQLVNQNAFRQSDKAYLVSGNNFLPALTIAPIAAMNKVPIFYADGVLSPYARLGMTQLGVKTVEIIGEVDEEIITALNSMGITVLKADADSVALAAKNYKNPSGIFVARKDHYADAAAGAFSAAKLGWPLLLVDRERFVLPQTIRDFIKTNKSINDVWAFGGPGVVSDSLLKDAYALALKNIPASTGSSSSSNSGSGDDPAPVENKVPQVTDVVINGTLKVGETLTGAYTYSDAENNAEGISLYRWLVSDTADGPYAAIPGAEGKTFVSTDAQAGKYIKFEVTPAALSGKSPGATVQSTAFGPIEAVLESLTWIKSFGDNILTYVQSQMEVKETADGGYIAVGTSSNNVYLLKVSANGTKEWEQTFGFGDGVYIDHGYDVLQTSDGGYIIAGDTMGANRGNNMNFLVIKTDANGNKQWEKAYGDNSYGEAEQAYSIDATNDGGFIIAGGKSAWDFYLIKIDSEGTQQWAKTYGRTPESWDKAYSVKQTEDDGFIVVGASGGYVYGSDNIYVVKTDQLGVPLWSYSYGNDDGSVATDVIETEEGYTVTGYVRTETHRADYCLIMLDKDGHETNFVTLVGPNDENYGAALDKTADGGYIITGETYAPRSNNQVYLIKTDRNGIMEWDRTFGSSSNRERGDSVLQTRDQGYISVGFTSEGSGKVYLVKTDAEGNVADLPLNSVPAASAVAITGTPKVGETLTGTYTYQDAENDTEGTPSFRWLISDTSDGQYSPIPGAVNKTLTLNQDQVGKYLKFEVTPRASIGTPTGRAVMSEVIGPIQSNSL